MKKRKWSQKEFDCLRQVYPKEGVVGFQKRFPIRSSQAIRTKASELKISCSHKYMSFIMFGKNNPMYGKSGRLAPRFNCNQTEDAKRKIGLAHRGKIVSLETRKKQRLAKLGKKHSLLTRKKMGKSHMGDNNPMKKPENKKKMSIITRKRYKDPRERAKMRKYGLKAIKTLRENAPYIFKRCKFDSRAEMDCIRLLFEASLINRIIEGKTVHIRMKGAEIDAQLNNGNFVEYHEINPFYKNDFEIIKTAKKNKIKPIKEYTRKRRNILNQNGYRKNKLIVFQSLHEVREFIVENGLKCWSLN